MPAFESVTPTTTSHLLLAFLMRTVTTFGAMVELGKLGYGEQTAMLNRSLFEQMVDAHWFVRDPELAADLLSDHEELTKAEFAAAARRRPGSVPAPPPDEEIADDDTVKALREKFGRGGMHWSTKRLRSRLADVKSQWPDGGEVLSFFADVPLKIDNLWLHPSPFGLKASVERTGSGLDFSFGPTGFYVQQALFNGCWNLGQVVSLALNELKPEGATSEVFERKALGPACAKFIVLTADEMKAGRNDRCPCGSGLKFKHCHGA